MGEKQQSVAIWGCSFSEAKRRMMERVMLVARGPYRRCLSLLRGRISEQRLQRIIRLCERIRYRYGQQQVAPHGQPVTLSTSPTTVLPDWVVAEMQDLSSIEPALYPSSELLAEFHRWMPPADPYPARLYQRMVGEFVDWKPQIVFLIPHLMRGGADLGALHHINLCCEQGLRVTVVITRDVKSPWRERIPAQARVVEFGQVTRYASESDRRLILLRLLLQSPARTLHLINSELGWQLMELFGKSLTSEGIRLFASVYCDDINTNGVRCSYSTDYLPKVWQYFSSIISDNRQFLTELQLRDGLPADRMHALYFPSAMPLARPLSGRGNVLWASRITAQKRPDLLLEIACAMPDVAFDVFGEADASCSSDILRALTRLPNVRLGGSFDSFAELAAGGDYDLFLYTSAYDGLPNVLLEATVAALPIIAETVGGVGELLDRQSGYPLDPGADCALYVAAIREVLAYPEEARQRVAHGQAVLRQRHSWATFSESLRAIPDYWPVEDGREAS